MYIFKKRADLTWWLKLIKGKSKAKYIHALWKWCSCLSREWTRQVTDSYLPPPLSFQIPVSFYSSSSLLYNLSVKLHAWSLYISGIHRLITYKLNTSIIVSYLIGLCRWEVVGGEGGIEYGPFPIPRNGLLATFRQHSL